MSSKEHQAGRSTSPEKRASDARAAAVAQTANDVNAAFDRATSPRSTRPTAANTHRFAALLEVFVLFDVNRSGTVETAELMQLGIARQRLGHKDRLWTEAKNSALVRRMDLNQNGLIDSEEFCKHFDNALPQEGFDSVIAEFEEVAVEVARTARLAALFEVFAMFDLDLSGTIESAELMRLGNQSSKLWTEAKNSVLIKQIDTNNNGTIEAREFCKHFEMALPKDHTGAESRLCVSL